MTRRATADQPEQADFVNAHPAGSRCHRHQPRRVQVHSQAHGRHSGHRPRAGNQPPLAQHHLVMHGSSSVPQDLLVINQYGGKMKETYR
jgi:hypothetical protein